MARKVAAMVHDGHMPSLGKTVGVGIREARRSARGANRVGRWVSRRVGVMRTRGGGGEVGMIRLLDLHAASCAGDTLVTMGLAGTVFFGATGDAARTNVALYLFVTMLPFAVVAPIVGPVLDRFRHGRRYALAATMLGRAFLAWLISDYIHGIGLYPAAFGVLLLSRAYGVARSAAVPRLLPAKLGLSEAGARASLFGTLAGAVVAPLGAAAFKIGPQWPLRVASVIFVVGMVYALRLPGRADSDPPETVPRIFVRGGRKVLSGKLIVAVITGGAMLRALLGFLTLFLAFAVRSHQVPAHIFGFKLSAIGALGVVAAGLGAGAFLGNAVGARLRIRRPVLLQAAATVLTAAAGAYATIDFRLFTVALLCLIASASTGLAKLAVDATIQERVREQVRASAFAHSETTLMIAWVFGGAFGLIPFGGRLGLGIATGLIALAAARAVLRVGVLRRERLRGEAQPDQPDPDRGEDETSEVRSPRRARWNRLRSNRAEQQRARTRVAEPTRPAAEPAPRAQTTQVMPRDVQPDDEPTYHLYRPSGRPPASDPDE
jgi:MFS family permease